MKFKKKLEQIFESEDFEDEWGEGIPPNKVKEVLERLEIDENKARWYLTYLYATSYYEGGVDVDDLMSFFFDGVEATKNYDFGRVLQEIGEYYKGDEEDAIENLIRKIKYFLF